MQFNLAIESLTSASHFDSPQTVDYHASIRQTSTTPKRDVAISPNKISPYPRWNFPPSWSIKLQLFPLSITCSTDLRMVIYAHKSLSISRLHWHGFHRPPEESSQVAVSRVDTYWDTRGLHQNVTSVKSGLSIKITLGGGLTWKKEKKEKKNVGIN